MAAAQAQEIQAEVAAAVPEVTLEAPQAAEEVACNPFSNKTETEQILKTSHSVFILIFTVIPISPVHGAGLIGFNNSIFIYEQRRKKERPF